MKKVGILSLEAHNHNYGCMLQQYALYSAINNMGYKTEIIDYQHDLEKNTFSYKRNIKYLTVRKVFDRLMMLTDSKKRINRTDLPKQSIRLFDEFGCNNLNYSPKFTFNEREHMGDSYDAVVCGSDQIWNPSYNIPSFFLDFVHGDRRRIIYAASIGIPELSAAVRKEYKRLLAYPDYISVREENAVSLIAPLTNKTVELVLDPTLLLGVHKWEELSGTSALIHEPYIFCYFLGGDMKKISAAKKFAEKIKMKVVSVPFQNPVCDEGIFPTYQQGVGPCEFLNLIRNANFILTDSFHASVFSILFGKSFRVFPRLTGKTNMNGRIETLLGYIDKKQYLIDCESLNTVQWTGDCQYDLTQIENRKSYSLEWLSRAIENEA